MARVGDERREPRLARGTARREVAAEAPAAQRDLLRVNVRQREREVDDLGDHRLPVASHGHALHVQHLALARAVEHQHVVAALRCGHCRGEIHVGDCGVVAVVEDEQGASLLLAPDGRNQVRGHRGARQRDAHRRDRMLAEEQGPCRNHPLQLTVGLHAGRCSHAQRWLKNTGGLCHLSLRPST